MEAHQEHPVEVVNEVEEWQKSDEARVIDLKQDQWLGLISVDRRSEEQRVWEKRNVDH